MKKRFVTALLVMALVACTIGIGILHGASAHGIVVTIFGKGKISTVIDSETGASYSTCMYDSSEECRITWHSKDVK